jgi:two-component system, chemotaxis family, protein-glutamate methylesterase/glutaminase
MSPSDAAPGRHGRPLRVLVADDSAVARQVLVHILNSDPELRVEGQAVNGGEAVQLTERVRPDVIVMDVLMPVLDGLAATRAIMATRPTPIVLVSAGFDSTETSRSFQAIQAGALTMLAKPPGPAHPDFPHQAAALRTAVKLMAEVKLVRRRGNGDYPTDLPAPAANRRRQVRIAAIAASTGGPGALAALLGQLPATIPVPILVVQHIAAGFHQGLVEWLDSVCAVTVQLAADGQSMQAGQVLVAPPHAHLGVTRTGHVALSHAPPIGAHQPSATHLFRSVGEAYAADAVAVVLTGMGDDGVAGLPLLKAAGGLVLAQDEGTSVVYGMPRQAEIAGLVDHVLPLPQIAPALIAAWTAGPDP